MAMFMTANNYTREDVMAKGEEIAFPESVKNLFRGDLGQPHGGFPKELQEMVLKGEKAYIGRPNAQLMPVDIEAEYVAFKQKFGGLSNDVP